MFLPAAACLAVACGESTSPGPVPAQLVLLSPDTAFGIAGRLTAQPVELRALDGSGDTITNALVQFEVVTGGGSIPASRRYSGSDGSVTIPWTLGAAIGPQTLRATGMLRDGSPSEATLLIPARAVEGSANLAAMVDNIPDFLDWWLGSWVSGSDVTQRAALESATLRNDILRYGRFADRTIPSAGGPIQASVIFPSELVRAEAMALFEGIDEAVSAMESLLGPWPRRTLQHYHGFRWGSSYGYPGWVDSHQRGSTAPSPEFYGSLANSYAGNFSFGRFVGYYVYNQMHGGSAAFDAWIDKGEYGGENDNNANLHALIDIYRRVGSTVMINGLKAWMALAPPYGPMQRAHIDAFLAHVPEADRPYVDAKLQKIVA